MKPYQIHFNHTSDLLAATAYYLKAGIHFQANYDQLTITLTGGY